MEGKRAFAHRQVIDMNQKESVPRQPERQPAGYCQWLAELDQEARQPGAI